LKVAAAQQHVIGSHGLSQTSAFKIKTNAHAFRMLSSGLYSDKPAAVLREIGCNAADAHTEYGTPEVPFEVKLPNRIDNQFYIKDFGPGLSHDNVMELYTTYFASTKQTSNEFTGAFGLGSKSPFSYTDSFSIVSVHGGKKRTYSAYIGNDGSPTISLLSEEEPDADWQHGVLIGFPIKVDDFGQFLDRASSIYSWFKVTPKVLGATIRPRVPLVDHPLFSRYSDVGLGVVMGNVYYPISPGNLGDMRDTPLAQLAPQITGIVLKLKIGDVQVAASRENLEYDPPTQKFLKERLQQVMEFIAAEVAEAFRRAKTWEEKCNIRVTASNWVSADSWQAKNLLTSLFTAAKFHDSAQLAALVSQSSVDAPASMGVDTVAKILSNFTRRNPHHIRAGFEEWVSDGETESSRAHVRMEATTVAAYGMRNLSILRARFYISQKHATQVLLFTPGEGKKVADAEREARKVAQELGGIKVIDLDKQPLPPDYVPRAKGSKKAKNASVMPLPSIPVEVYTIAAQRVNQDVSKLPASTQNFMTKSRSRWRIFEKNEDSDRQIDWNVWNNAWSSYSLIARSLGIKDVTGYVALYASKVRDLDLPKRGWKTTDVVVKEVLEQKAVRAALAKLLQKHKIAINLQYRPHDAPLPYGLVWLKHGNAALWDQHRATFDKYGLAKPVEEIHKNSIAINDGKGAIQEPKELEAYKTLLPVFDLKPIQPSTGGYLTIEDFTADIQQKAPLAAHMQARELWTIAEKHPEKIPAYIDFLFT
jgi:hypothetical protein